MSSLLLALFFLCMYIFFGENGATLGYCIFEAAILALLVAAAVWAA